MCLSMITRSGRVAQVGAKGRSAPSPGTQGTTCTKTRVPKGSGIPSAAQAISNRDQGAAEVAAVVSIAGTSDVDPTTALLHQVVPYDNEVVPEIPKAPILSDTDIIGLRGSSRETSMANNKHTNSIWDGFQHPYKFPHLD